MMMRGLVLFGYDKPNKYSWAIMMGYLEQDPLIMGHIDFVPLPFQLYHAPAHEAALHNIDFSQYQFVVIAYSLMSIQLPQFTDFMAVYPRYFAKFHPNIISVVGGPHVSASLQEFANCPVDFAVQGEGEGAFQSLLRALIQKGASSIEMANLAGVVRLSPRLEPGPPTELVPLGGTPSFSPRFRLFGPIEISRGCPFRCKFCQTGHSSQLMRHAPVERLLQWIELGSRLKYDKLWFLTPNAFAYGSKNGVTPHLDSIHRLLSGIAEIPAIKKVFFGTFPSEVRPESVTPEVLELVSPYISNAKLLVGAQTASNRLLKVINRGHTIEQVYSALEIIQQHGFHAEVDFIFGLPGENEDDIAATVAFLEDVLSGTLKNVRIHTHTFMPLPGTPFENEPRGAISPRLSEIVGKLAKEGKAYGEYQAQAGLVDTRYSR